jgi:4-hydroxy-2-oxoheptanedioate aldolase
LVTTWLKFASPEMAEVLALAGFDGVILDLEHGELGPRDVANLVRAVEVGGARAIVRVAGLGLGQVLGALDAGAVAVLVPNVGSAARAQRAVEEMSFPPRGSRGASPSSRALAYGLTPFTSDFGSDDAMLGVQIESRAGIEHVDEILDVEGIDYVFLGPFDLAVAFGVPGQPQHPLVANALQEVASVASRRGIPIGVAVGTASGLEAWAGIPLTLVAVSSAVMMLSQAAQEALRGTRARLA